MRIIVDNSGYHLRNMGDVAMLQVAVRRLRDIFPDAEVMIPTSDRQLLSRYVGGTALDARTWRGWHGVRLFPVKRSQIPTRVSARLDVLEGRVHRAFPVSAARVGRLWRKFAGDSRHVTVAGIRTITNADLVVASGGGYLTDEFRGHAMGVLDTLELAQAAGKPTVLLGQGIGPVTEPTLQARIRDVLGGAHLIALREGRVGRALLESLGVAGDKIVVSGDDAIEPAYEGRPGTVGNDIGVGIRFAWYSSLGPENVRFLSSAVADTARRHGAVLRPIPIDWRDARDLSALRSVLEGYSGQVIWPADDSPEAVIGQTGRCRVVVTGSYHAGVFALAQGIPVVALAKSQYYVDKFSGLAELFRGGCAVLTFDSPDFGAALVAAIDRAWQSAAAARPLLIEAAIRQIEASRSVYGRIAALVHH